MVLYWIGILLAGVVIGLLGKFVAPGDRDNIPLWLTVLCGVGGVLLGIAIANALNVRTTGGLDWIQAIISIGVAAVLVMIAATVTGRTSRRTYLPNKPPEAGRLPRPRGSRPAFRLASGRGLQSRQRTAVRRRRP